MTFRDFLVSLREKSGLTKTDLAKKISVSFSYISHLESGRAGPPTPNRCDQIAHALGATETERKKLMELAILERAPSEIRGILQSKGIVVRSPRASYEKEQWGEIPLLGSAPAGPMNIAPDEAEEWLPVRKKDVVGKKAYILRASGDSMNRAGIEEGDLLFVNHTRSPRDGDIVVVRIEGEATIKRFYSLENQKVKLMPDSTNPIHDPQTYDARKVEIMLRGVVEAVYMKKVK